MPFVPVPFSFLLVHNTNDPVLPPDLIGRLEAAEVQGSITAAERAAILEQSQARMARINGAWDRVMEVVNSDVPARSPAIIRAVEQMEAILQEIASHIDLVERVGRIPIRP